MKFSWAKFFFVSIAVFILLVFFLGLNKSNIYNTKNLVGQSISAFSLNSINGLDTINEIKLKKNNFTLINFWASWCKPCRLEHKYLLALKKNNSDLKILGINFKDKKKNALKFLLELKNPYNFVATDKNGKASVIFGVYGIPESILIDKNLIIIKKIVGPITESDYSSILELIK